MSKQVTPSRIELPGGYYLAPFSKGSYHIRRGVSVYGRLDIASAKRFAAAMNSAASAPHQQASAELQEALYFVDRKCRRGATLPIDGDFVKTCTGHLATLAAAYRQSARPTPSNPTAEAMAKKLYLLGMEVTNHGKANEIYLEFKAIIAAALEAHAAAVREEAAQVCDRQADEWAENAQHYISNYATGGAVATRQCATRIRALRTPKAEGV